MSEDARCCFDIWDFFFFSLGSPTCYSLYHSVFSQQVLGFSYLNSPVYLNLYEFHRLKPNPPYSVGSSEWKLNILKSFLLLDLSFSIFPLRCRETEWGRGGWLFWKTLYKYLDNQLKPTRKIMTCYVISMQIFPSLYCGRNPQGGVA